MKIIKKVGEKLLPSWLRTAVRPVLAFAGAGTALRDGSLILAVRGWAWLGDRFTPLERLGVLAAGAYAIGYTALRASSDVLSFAIPGTVIAWCAAAWYVSPPAEAPPAEPPAPDARAAFTTWLLDLIGDAPGIHLRDLYPAMRKFPGHEDRDNAQLRAALRTLGIPVRRSLRLGGVAGRSGVARADLLPLLSPAGESVGETDGDAGQAADSPAGESPVERLESA